MAGRVAVIAGASGRAGAALVRHLAGTPGWKVVGICRRPPVDSVATGADAGVTYLALDLADARACRAKLAGLRDATHLFYAGRAPHGEHAAEDVEANVAMLANAVEALEPAAPGLAHVHLVHGTNHYGVGLGPYETPAREDDPRLLFANFYYAQQDYIAQARHGRPWTWSISRPDVICDVTPGRPRNLLSIIAAYALICREIGRPFFFPGRPGAFAALVELTDAALLARAAVWMATTPACADQAFNVTNGGPFRWRRMWPRLAARFGLEPGPAQTASLAALMADKGPVWDRIVARHGLTPLPLDRVAQWSYADVAFGREYDQVSDVTKARLLGFGHAVDTWEMIERHLDGYRAAGVIP